ncbi:MAG: hypothetical protein LBN21_04390, partial [Treponema sp.]|jgi:hypothetical protein|nr:hypothetical protein [Treponema sp.]
MNKQKKANPFNADYSDRYTLPPDADSFHNNSQYFSIHDAASRRTLYMRLAVRGGDAPDEVWLVYREGDGPVYIAGKDHISKGEKIPASIECIEGGKELRFRYWGNLKRGKLTDKGYVPDPDSPDFPVDLDARFYGKTQAFEFSRHMSTEPVARALSKEKFTKDFQAALAENHQVHFEQAGLVSGILKLEGRDIVFEKARAFRDHSYGKRDWGYMDRHIWLVGLLENGDFFHTSLIRYPAIRNLQAGFYTAGEGDEEKTVCLKNSTSMDDLPLNGGVPPAFSFTVEYEDGKKRRVECTLDFTVPFDFGGGAYFLSEGVSEFTVDGLKGRGITEFGYNADSSRWNP